MRAFSGGVAHRNLEFRQARVKFSRELAECDLFADHIIAERIYGEELRKKSCANES